MNNECETVLKALRDGTIIRPTLRKVISKYKTYDLVLMVRPKGPKSKGFDVSAAPRTEVLAFYKKTVEEGFDGDPEIAETLADSALNVARAKDKDCNAAAWLLMEIGRKEDGTPDLIVEVLPYDLNKILD